MTHPAKTLMGENVVFYKQGNPDPHAAVVIATHDDPHCACLTFYCPKTHAWLEATDVQFGQAPDRDYYVNVE